jgi:glycosyltransferase involved in cell wall biosynthesis
MSKVLLPLKKLYTSVVQRGIYRILSHSPTELIRRGVKRNQLFQLYFYLVQRAGDLLYHDFIIKGQANEEEQQKLQEFYLGQFQRNTDVLLSHSKDRMRADHEFNSKFRAAYFNFISSATHPLFELAPKSVTEETKYTLVLGERFKELLTGKFRGAPELPKQVTVVYPFRDRDVDRLRVSVNSLYKHSSVGVSVIVVDFGSSPKYQAEVSKLSEELNFKVIRSETYGRPWSRGTILNIGIRAAETEFIATTDMDMIFDADVLGVSLARYAEDKVMHCRPLWLPENGDADKAYLGNYDQLGGYLFMKKDVFEKMGGFSEAIQFWGLEDTELDKRMKNKVIESVWIDDEVSMYHMWHPLQYGALDLRPVSSWQDSSYVLMSSGHVDSLNREWGMPIVIGQRPIIEKIDHDNAFEIEITDYLNQIDSMITQSKEHKFVKLNLGQRLPGHSEEFIKFMSKLSQDFDTYASEMAVKKNKNIDYLYLSLDILKAEGLVDYFLSDDLDYAYLLFK